MLIKQGSTKIVGHYALGRKVEHLNLAILELKMTSR